MSVLIKDMEKPKSCYAVIDGEFEYCPFVNTDNDCVLLLKKGICEGTWEEQYSKCPLIETPEPCEDAVSRQGAIDAVIRMADQTGTITTEAAEYALENLPSAQPEQRWISVSERLPENGRQVLVYAISTHFALAKYDEMREADGSYKKQWVTFDAWKPFYTVKNVIAWCELPEPYRGGREG